MSLFRNQQTAQGFSRVSLAEIIAALEALWKSSYGADVDLNPRSADGQVIGGMAEMFDDLNNGLADLVNVLNPSDLASVPEASPVPGATHAAVDAACSSSTEAGGLPSIVVVHLGSHRANVTRDVNKKHDGFRNSLQHQPLDHCPHKASDSRVHCDGPRLLRGIGQNDNSNQNQHGKDDPSCDSVDCGDAFQRRISRLLLPAHRMLAAAVHRLRNILSCGEGVPAVARRG